MSIKEQAQSQGVPLILNDAWNWGGTWIKNETSKPFLYNDFNPQGVGDLFNKDSDLHKVHLALNEIQEPEKSSYVQIPYHTKMKLILRNQELETGRLRLSKKMIENIPPTADVLLVDRNWPNGNGRIQPKEFSRRTGSIENIDYDLNFIPGTIINCELSPSGTKLTLKATSLPTPIEYKEIEIFYEYDQKALESLFSTIPIPREQLKRRRIKTWENAILFAFEERGKNTSKPLEKVLSKEELAMILLKPSSSEYEIGSFLAALGRMGLRNQDDLYFWKPEVSLSTSSSETVTFKGAGTGIKGGILRDRVAHMVLMHLRKSNASGIKKKSYAEARKKYGLEGTFQEILPEGYTWVTPHERGKRKQE